VVAGWDIGGVNVKAACLTAGAGGGVEARVTVRPFEIWREPRALVAVLGEVAREAGIAAALPMAVTTTAELSDAFASRREGVLRVLDAVRQAFAVAPVRVLSTSGELVPLEEARRRPLEFAATNWMASALFVAERQADCVLIDVGSTTTDIIPVRGGRVAAEGRTDAARLAAGELVYTGVLRTNPNTLAAMVPWRGRRCRVAAESFTQMADVYLLLGRLSAGDYSCPTSDGRGKSPEEARARLARLVCEDAETQTEQESLQIARHLHERQVQQVADGLLQVLSRQTDVPALPLLPAGIGAFLAAEVGRRLGLTVLDPESVWRGGALAALPASAVAALMARHLQGRRPCP
jgi:hypothetical protein